MQLVDVNVIVDAAQTIYRAWDACRPVMSLPAGERDDGNFASVEDAVRTLERNGHLDLARQVREEKVPLELLQAKVNGSTLSRSVSTAPPPDWLRQALYNHPDSRVRDLAHAAESGSLALTTYTLSAAQAITATRPVRHESESVRPGKVPVGDAENLVHALTFGRELISTPMDLAEAISSGVLDEALETARTEAGEHVAAFSGDDPYWRVSKENARQVDDAKPAGMTWREYKARQPDVYGIDGDDVYMLYQAQVVAAQLGRKVVLTTSDYHLAMAAAKTGLPSRLYSLEGDTIKSMDVNPHQQAPRRTMRMPVRAEANPRREVAGVGQ